MDADTGKCEASGHATLEGAEFEIRYYKGLYEEDPAKKGNESRKNLASCGQMLQERSLLIRSIRSVAMHFLELSDGEAAFPLGTVTIRETKAPDGYRIPLDPDTKTAAYL